jgi:nitrous oxide reductase accessory protein NosL
MRSSINLLAIFCLVAFSSLVFGQEGSNPSQKLKCPVCSMLAGMFADTNATIQFKDSPETLVFDGSKCMFKYYLNVKQYNPSKTTLDIASVTVKDFYSTESVDAMQAYYVIWSDTYGPMGHEPIPFGKEEDAKKFLKEHKGKKIIRFNEVNMKLIKQLDNP